MPRKIFTLSPLNFVPKIYFFQELASFLSSVQKPSPLTPLLRSRNLAGFFIYFSQVIFTYGPFGEKSAPRPRRPRGSTKGWTFPPGDVFLGRYFSFFSGEDFCPFNKLCCYMRLVWRSRPYFCLADSISALSHPFFLYLRVSPSRDLDFPLFFLLAQRRFFSRDRVVFFLPRQFEVRYGSLPPLAMDFHLLSPMEQVIPSRRTLGHLYWVWPDFS